MEGVQPKRNHRKYNNAYTGNLEKGLKGYYLCKRIITNQIYVVYHSNTVNRVNRLLLLLRRGGCDGGGRGGL